MGKNHLKVVFFMGCLSGLFAIAVSMDQIQIRQRRDVCDQSMKNAIDAKYSQVSNTLGPPVDGLYHHVARNDGGCYRVYANGIIYYNAVWGAHEIHGAILAHYSQITFDVLGYPSTDETVDPLNPAGLYNEFEGSSRIYWSPNTGAWTIWGSILGRWNAHQGDDPTKPLVRDLLGYPTSDETDGPNGGKYNTFVKGSIYWHPYTGAHEIQGAIHNLYLSLGGPNSYLGYPATDETTEGNSQFNAFAGGWIYWNMSAGAKDTPYRVHGGRTYTGLEPDGWKDQRFWDNLRDWTAASPTTYLYRRNVVKNAFVEASLGLCWPQAKSRYCTAGGTECWNGWCSELAHYILMMNYGGIHNLSGPGLHNDLGDAYTVGGFKSVFEDNSTHSNLWVPHDKINEWTIEPGDYLSTMNGDHSTIVVGVKWDKTQLWTVERLHLPDSDCVGPRPYDYKLANGTINPTFYGVGILHCDMVDSSACVVQPIPLKGPTALGDDMQSGEVLYPYQSISSPNGQYTLVYQGDGNLVLYRNSDRKALWASNTDRMPTGGVIMQSNGDLVIYDSVLNPIWTSDTWQHPGSRLVVQDDGNVVIYRPDNKAVWATNTEDR